MNGMDASTGAALEGADHLRQSIARILGTPLGSRLGRRSFGSLLPELLDQPMNALTRIRVFAASALALQLQEPRLKAAKFSLAGGDRPGAAVLTIQGQRTDAAQPNTGITFSIPVRSLSALSA